MKSIFFKNDRLSEKEWQVQTFATDSEAEKFIKKKKRRFGQCSHTINSMESLIATQNGW